jgi:hypothetical protein
MTHLNIWNISYGQKKGRGSNWQSDSRPLKVKNHLDFLTCRWRVTYCWKTLDKGYYFTLDFISIGGLHTKLWAPKIARSQLWEFWDSHLWVLGQSDIWVLVPWPSTKYTIRRKLVASPKFGSWWIIMNPCLPMAYPCTKMPQLRTTCYLICVGPCK